VACGHILQDQGPGQSRSWGGHREASLIRQMAVDAVHSPLVTSVVIGQGRQTTGDGKPDLTITVRLCSRHKGTQKVLSV